jgi:2-oxopent-4-enoate/cis-2-oxohex-4-enoate hydratase
VTEPKPLGLASVEHGRLADLLIAAARDGRALVPLSRWYPELTVGDACRIRDILLARRLSDGEQLIGGRVSLGDGVPEPRLCWLTDGMLLPSATVDLDGLARPRVEPKLAFRLGRTLRGQSATAVLAATESVIPCLEILDSRYDRPPPEVADDIAENGASAMLLVGEGVAPLSDGQLRRIRVQFRVDGPVAEPVRALARGTTAVPPLEAVSWLGNELVAAGLPPGPGTLMVSQAIGPAVELADGVRVVVDFPRLGSLELQAAAATR